MPVVYIIVIDISVIAHYATQSFFTKGYFTVGTYDATLLKQMVDVDVLKGLLDAFGEVGGIGAGIFTPEGIRIGEPAHHSAFCRMLYASTEGERRCSDCDKKRIDALLSDNDNPQVPYDCHAGLIDFAEPIYCSVGGEKLLIGVFFAGQILYEDAPLVGKTIKELRLLASACRLNSDELVAQYMKVPRVSRERVVLIRSWMKQFAALIGFLVQRKADVQRLLLDVIRSADDQNEVVRAVARHLHAGAVSIFLRRGESLQVQDDRIFLVATTSENLARKIKARTPRQRARTPSYRPGQGLTGWVYETGRVLHLPDVRDKSCYPSDPYPQWARHVVEIDVKKAHAFLGAPIRSEGGSIVGVIRAVRPETDGPFQEDEIELLTGVASLVAATATKAELYKDRSDQIAALDQVHSLLEMLAEPHTDLSRITMNMASRLAERYVKNGPWGAVYVIRHLKPLGEMQIIAASPDDPLPGESHTGFCFPDSRGVAGQVLKTGTPVVARDSSKSRVSPVKQWSSFVGAPIFRKSEIWGVVCLVGNAVPEAAFAAASPEIVSFAGHVGIVCRFSDILDAMNSAAVIASNILSLNLEAHEVLKSLESANASMELLCEKLLNNDNADLARGISRYIEDGVSWAGACLELGKFTQLAAKNPNAAIAEFRSQFVKDNGNGESPNDQLWEVVDITDQAQEALESVRHQQKTHNAEIQLTFPKSPRPYLIGDGNLIYRAFRNLLENALVYGSRKVEGNHGSQGRLIVRFSITYDTQKEKVLISVSDNGQGMSPESLSATQEIYGNPALLGQTLHTPGFGTMIVAFAVFVHEGTIAVSSKNSEGVQVDIEIPAFLK
jgi:ligand-binding sensor protein